MKNKKGFTLVEILGVIAILSVLALIAIPTIDNIVTKNREKLYNSQIKTIEDGMKTWANANAISLPEDGDDALLLSLGILKLAGFVDEDIKNPNTDLCFSNDMLVSISAVKEGYTYYVDEESGLDGTEEDCSAPTASEFIFLKGSSTVELSLGDTYEETGFVALDASGNISTGSVTSMIKDKNGTVVDSINSTENNNGPYTITYTYGSAIKTRIINIYAGDPIGTEYVFDYTGGVQNITLTSGIYKIEVWGAQGGTPSRGTGGYGAYALGVYEIATTQKLYLVVGGTGVTCTVSGCTAQGGYNGGGSVVNAYSTNSDYYASASGGGATHIATVDGILSSLLASKASILLVAGGGGGGSYYGSYAGGSGGGISGSNGIQFNSSYGYGIGGTQTTGGVRSSTESCTGMTFIAGGFGYGGYITTQDSFASGWIGAGGGGGYYGGGTGGAISSAGGGSSYIEGVTSSVTYGITKAMYCYNCNTSSDINTLTYTTTNISNVPTSNYAKIGNGYAKITKIGM